MSAVDTGRVPEGTGLSQAEPEEVSALTGFDPSRMARQMQRHLANLELRSNTSSSWATPSPKDKTSGYCVAEIPDWQLRQWIAALDAIATEAGTAETTQIGSVHEGAGPQDIAQGQSS